MGMKNKQMAKEIAERRMGMIASLIGALSSQEEYYEKRREISIAYEVSTRTIQRYAGCGRTENKWYHTDQS